MKTANKLGRLRAANIRSLLLGTLIASTHPAFSDQLSEFRWKNRPLFLFAPDHRDPDLQQVQRDIRQRSCDVADRDMVIGIFVERGRSRLDGKGISAGAAAMIRQQFGIIEGRFTVLLIGKDGGEKMRSHGPTHLNTVFSLIDAMPMRRTEMLARPARCDQTAL